MARPSLPFVVAALLAGFGCSDSSGSLSEPTVGKTQAALAPALDCPDATDLGQLVDCINGAMPDKLYFQEVGRAFEAPSAAVQADWQNVVDAMLAGARTGDCVSDITLPASLNNYRLVSFPPASPVPNYCVLMEVLSEDSDTKVDKGWGTLIVNPNANRELSIQIVHPQFDIGTIEQGIELFQQLGARTFLMAGTHRHASPICSADQPKDCTAGTPIEILDPTAIITTSYLETDAAHNVGTLFQRTVERIQSFYGVSGEVPDEATLDGFVALQFHSMDSSTCAEDVYMTYGVDAPAGSPGTDDVLSQLRQNLANSNAGWVVGVPGPTSNCSLGGGDNVQGRLLNGVPADQVGPLANYAASYSGRFIHIEQKSGHRSSGNWFNALKTSFPSSLDLVFVIDVTGSMWDDIEAVQARASAIVDRIASTHTDVRIGIVVYKDHPVSPWGGPTDVPANLVMPFTSDVGEIHRKIAELTVGGGADEPEAVYSGLMQAISMPWRNGVTKTIILMGDAPPHDPEPVTGYTVAQVSQAAYDADPIIIHSVIVNSGDVAPEMAAERDRLFTQLARDSQGTVVSTDGANQVVDAILQVLNTVIDLPPLAAAGPDQLIACISGPHVQVILDGSGSRDPEGAELTYTWTGPFGTLTGATVQPTLPLGSHEISLTVTDAAGNSASDTVKVTVQDSEAPAVLLLASTETLWPPNHKMTNVTVRAKAIDLCTPAASFTLLSVTASSSEPDDGDADGDTTGDVNGADGYAQPVDVTPAFQFDPTSGEFEGVVAFRAERSGGGDGRSYTLQATVADTSGNRSTASAIVTVPHQ